MHVWPCLVEYHKEYKRKFFLFLQHDYGLFLPGQCSVCFYPVPVLVKGPDEWSSQRLINVEMGS